MIKTCPRCQTQFEGRTKFCRASCRYWFNLIKKEKEESSGLPPLKKRTKAWFSMVTGSAVAKMKNGTRQGKRSGNMVHGSMGARVNCTTEQWAELNAQNLRRHFTCISFYRPSGIWLGDGTYVKEADIETVLGIITDEDNKQS